LSGMLLDQCVEELTLPAFARKMRRVMEADLYYPIILGENGCIFGWPPSSYEGSLPGQNIH
jgi:hypothetical protein